MNWGWNEGGDGPTSGWSEASSYCIFVIPRSAMSVFSLVFLTPVNYSRYIHSSFTSLYPSTGGTFGLGIVSSYMGNIYMWISKHLKIKIKTPSLGAKLAIQIPSKGSTTQPRPLVVSIRKREKILKLSNANEMSSSRRRLAPREKIA